MTAFSPAPKHPGVMVRQEQPFNAETPLNLLRRDYVTPRELFYVRNHGSLPAVDPATYRLTVSVWWNDLWSSPWSG